MDKERWKEIDAILDAALEMPAAERERFITERTAGDPELEKAVLDLLRAAAKADRFMERPAISLAAESLANAETERTQFGLANALIANYRIERMIGAGGMGDVYLAFDEKLKRNVALKILPPEFSSHDDRVVRFELEARAVSKLNHPGIVTLYDIGLFQGVNYIATEFVEGRTLRELMGGKFKLRNVIANSIQICDALSAAHESGIVHRDIKPENIMIVRDDAVPGGERAKILERAADLMESRRMEINSLLILEGGKPWVEADGDTSEAIDFLRFYAVEMRRMAKPVVTQAVPGESCVQVWTPRGVGVAVAPWNFPLAILTGLTVAPLVAGNCVIIKPARQTSIIGAYLMEIMMAAGVPAGALHYLPCSGADAGAHLGLRRYDRNRLAAEALLIVEREFRRVQPHRRPRHLALEREPKPLARRDRDHKPVRSRALDACFQPAEEVRRRLLELHDDLCHFAGHLLARAQIERHAGPAPRLKLDA